MQAPLIGNSVSKSAQPITRLVCCIITATARRGSPPPDHISETARASFNNAVRFADQYNWYAARAYFRQAEKLFEAAGDKRNALYAHWGALRALTAGQPVTTLPYRLAEEISTNSLLQSDKELRMFGPAIKGDFDGEIDTVAMSRDWEQVRALARELGNTKWKYRAQGQLGFADF